MLLVRRRAPKGSFVVDTEQASAAVNVAGTVLAVLIGFVFLISFQSYINARTAAVTASLPTTAFIDTPAGEHEGAIGPAATKSTVASLQRERTARHPQPLPCTAGGRPLAARS